MAKPRSKKRPQKPNRNRQEYTCDGRVQFDTELTDQQIRSFRRQVKNLGKRLGWTDENHRVLVEEYVAALVSGRDEAPAKLCFLSIELVRGSFVLFCRTQQIPHTVDKAELAAVS